MIISAQTLLTGDGKTIMTDSGVLVLDGRIAAVDKTEILRQAYPNVPNIDYGTATILPGLIDMHVHLGYYDGRRDAKLYTKHMISYLALYNAQRFLFGGTTTVRDVFGPDAVCRQLAFAAEKGFVCAPRIVHCNQALTPTGGIDWSVDGTVEVDGPEEIRKAVREQARAGARWIKAMTDWRTSGLAEFDQDELDMIVRESHRRGLKAAAHANMQPSLQMCIDAGFDTIEHACRLTVDQAEQMAEKGLAVVSTFYIYEYLYNSYKAKQEQGFILTAQEKKGFESIQSNVETYEKNYPEIFKTGVTILAGTDCPFDGMEDITVAVELEYMVKHGMTPLEAIAAATGKPASVLGMAGEIGTLAPGAVADILVADANADKDITALKRIKDVYQSGKKVHCES